MALFNEMCRKTCLLPEGKSCEYYAYCENNYNNKNSQIKKPNNEKAIERYLEDLIKNTNEMYSKLNLQIEEMNLNYECTKKEYLELKKDITKLKNGGNLNGSKKITARNISKK